jgi:glycerophosphoryl diester phosphodiesterase
VCVGGFNESWLSRARAGGGDKLCTSMAYASAFALRGRAWLDRLPGRLAQLPSPTAHGTLAQLPHRYGPLSVVDADFLATAHASGREVHCWTIDTAEEMVELLDLGVDGLLSDRPDILRDVLRKRGEWPGQ